jgi:hypothetical protein
MGAAAPFDQNVIDAGAMEEQGQKQARRTRPDYDNLNPHKP